MGEINQYIYKYILYSIQMVIKDAYCTGSPPKCSEELWFSLPGSWEQKCVDVKCPQIRIELGNS